MDMVLFAVDISERFKIENEVETFLSYSVIFEGGEPSANTFKVFTSNCIIN